MSAELFKTNGIDACAVLPDGKVAYFFKEGSYLRFHIARDRVDQDPRSIREWWSGWPESWWAGGIQGAVAYGPWIYFFRGGEYLRYDLAADRVSDGYPKAIADHWHGWPAAWRDGIDGCVGWTNGLVYFFKGSEYIRYDLTQDKVTGAPRPIASAWGKWPSGWSGARMNGGGVWPSGIAYLFSGPNYIQYSVAEDAAKGAPAPIKDNWNRWPGYVAPNPNPNRRLVIYNDSREARAYYVYLNDDESKSAVLRGIQGTVKPNSYAIVDVSEPWVQVIIDTGDPNISFDSLAADKNENARGYLVTDLATSGAKAWVYIGGAKGAWDFRAGSGHSYRVAVKARGGMLYHWTDANADMSVPIKGRGDGAQTSSDSWNVNSTIQPLPDQPNVP